MKRKSRWIKGDLHGWEKGGGGDWLATAKRPPAKALSFLTFLRLRVA
jgi:hypothetical protein